jgi:hypothetical protein
MLTIWIHAICCSKRQCLVHRGGGQSRCLRTSVRWRRSCKYDFRYILQLGPWVRHARIPLRQVALFHLSFSSHTSSPIQNDEHCTNSIGSARLGRGYVETNLAVGTSFHMVRQMLCATALIDDLAIPCVGLAESADECEEGTQRQMGRKLGISSQVQSL